MQIAIQLQSLKSSQTVLCS